MTPVDVGKLIESLNIENKILTNDMSVMNLIVKEILNSEIHVIDGKQYIELADIISICQKGFNSLSSKIRKEKDGKRDNKSRK